MTEKRAIIGKVKRLLDFVLGANLPSWVYPATLGAAMTPVVAHAIDAENKKERAKRRVAEGLFLPPVHEPVVYHPNTLKYASADINKLAQGLDRMRALMNDAKRRGRKRRARATLDAVPSISKPAGKGARGRSSGSMRLGNGGGYGK